MGAMSHLARCSLENTPPAKSKWQKLKLYVRARKMRVSTAPSENQITWASLREEDRSGGFVLPVPETIGRKLEDLRGQNLRDLAKDYFDVNYSNLLLLDDLNDYIDLMISISNSINEHDEVSDINLLVEKINRFKKARDPFPAFVETIHLLSKWRREIRQTIQTVEEENESKFKRFKIWKKVIRIVSGLVFVIAVVGVLSLSFVAPPMAVIATFAATLVRWGEELMLSFCKKREGELKEMIKLVNSINEGSVLEDPSMIERINKFTSGDIKKLKSAVDQLIHDKNVNAAKKGVDGLTFQKRAVELKGQIEKWCDIIKQRSRMVVCCLK